MKRIANFLIMVLLLISLIACSNGSRELKIGQSLGAPHGTKAFSITTVVMDGEKILKAHIDEYQYLPNDGFIGVPNSESFNEDGSVEEGFVLGSKRVNNEGYSKNMADNAGSTIMIAKNYDGIQEFVVGKTLKELEELSNEAPGKVIDAISGVTLVDSHNYLKEIIAAANSANVIVKYSGDVSKLTLNQVDGAPHGNKSFSVTSVLTDGETVVAAMIDEFQYLASDSSIGVPNSDSFTEAGSIAEGLVLGSKRVNDESYSKNMADHAGSTITIAKNYDGIQEFVAGKTIKELEELVAKSAKDIIDTVSSVTLVDTPNYLKEIIAAAKSTK